MLDTGRRHTVRQRSWTSDTLWLAVILLTATLLHGQQAPNKPLRPDKYGGAYHVAQGTGYFRTAKVGNRWMLLTPEGNAFFMIGAYGLVASTSINDSGDSYQNRVIRKYGDSNISWAPQMNRRLQRWGFNTLEIGAVYWALPSATDPHWRGGQQPVKMPFVAMIRPAYYSLYNQNHWGPGPTKDLFYGLPKYYTDWKAPFPDVFDPNFDQWLVGALAMDPYIQGVMQPAHQQWIVGVTCDDTDELNGYGPAPETPGLDGAVAPHLGWVTLVTNFEQTRNPTLREPQVYADRKVYSKYAMRDWLREKYQSLQSLNAAWGSQYSSWDSNGGWGSGTGFLDEDGRHSWVGKDWERLSKATPRVKADLDEWLYILASKHLSVCRTRIKQRAPNLLFMGPTAMSTHNGVSRLPLLRAYGEQADLVSITWRDSQKYLDLTAAAIGDKPIITWNGACANPDSALWRYRDEDKLDPVTQVDRGRMYRHWITQQFNATVTATGVHPFVGFRWWEVVDNWGEKANWGLVSSLDNAYDGREARKAADFDYFGYPTGGEERDYGDFVGAVRQANEAITEQVRQQAAALSATGARTDSGTRNGH